VYFLLSNRESLNTNVTTTSYLSFKNSPLGINKYIINLFYNIAEIIFQIGKAESFYFGFNLSSITLLISLDLNR